MKTMKATLIKTDRKRSQSIIEVNGHQLYVPRIFSEDPNNVGRELDLRISALISGRETTTISRWKEVFGSRKELYASLRKELFTSNPEKRKELVYVSGFEYRGFGEIALINPIIVDCGIIKVGNLYCPYNVDKYCCTTIKVDNLFSTDSLDKYLGAHVAFDIKELMITEILDHTFEVDGWGYLEDPSAWVPEYVEAIARKDRFVLSPDHWIVINYFREFYTEYQMPPPRRMSNKTLQKKLGKKNIDEYLSKLFPQGIAWQASKYAGIPRLSGWTPPTLI